MDQPRRSLWGLALGVTGTILAGFALVGGVLVATSVPMARGGWQLYTQGLAARGQVTSRRQWQESCGKDGMDSCPRYEIDYRFTTPAGEARSQARVDAATYDRLAEGATLDLIYLPSDPGRTELAAGDGLTAGLGLGALGLGFLFGGGIPFALRLRRAAQMIRLREDGTLRQARVTARKETAVKINGRPQWVIRWQDSAGQTGKSRMSGFGRLPAAGETITIYADPEGRIPPVWEGDCGSR